MRSGGGNDGDGRGYGGGYLGEGNSPPRCRIPKTICCDDGITMEREAASADQARGGGGRGRGGGETASYLLVLKVGEKRGADGGEREEKKEEV